MEGGKDRGTDIGEGSKVSAEYNKKTGEKTAVGVKGLGKGPAKAVSN